MVLATSSSEVIQKLELTLVFGPISCGSMAHKTKDCMERPRSKGAKWTGKHIAADEKVEHIVMESFEAKRDRWNGYDTAEHARVVDT